MTEAVKIYHVDAFTDRPFKGNPAAECLLEKPADERWMQSMAGMRRSLRRTCCMKPGFCRLTARPSSTRRAAS